MVNHAKVSSKVERINKSIAYLWLGTSPGNRGKSAMISRSRAAISGLVADMRSKRFVMNGQPIIFDEDGRLMNGHARLLAIIEADVEVEVLVVRGIPRDYDPTQDRGQSHTLGDVASSAGYQNGTQLAAAAKQLHLWQYGMLSDNTTKAGRESAYLVWTSSRMLEFLREHPKLSEYVYPGRDAAKAIGVLPSIVIAMYYVTSEADPDVHRAFWSGIQTGEMLQKTDPRLRLRETALGWRTQRRSMTSRLAAIAISKAWNAFVTTTPMHLLKILGSEKVPVLIGVPTYYQYGELRSSHEQSEKLRKPV